MKRNASRTLSVLRVALGVLALSTGLAANANAACGVLTRQLVPDGAVVLSTTAARYRPISAPTLAAPQVDPAGASIVGMWQFQVVAKDSPPIPDGTVLDAGFSVWHSDGTEIMNSVRPPATGNICLGVWTKSGPSTYKLNHKALNFDSAGNLIGPATIREEVTIDRSGDSFSGTFEIDFFDKNGHVIGHASGTVTAERVTVN